MDALDLHPLTLTTTDTALGTDADRWFMALDGRAVQVGDDTGILRVEGIHSQGATLWIQVSLFGDDVPGLVLRVEGCHTQHDVFAALQHYEPAGVPLEIVRI